MTGLIGLTLEEAERRLREVGIEPRIEYTRSLREDEEGTLRVIRAREGGLLTAARFPDQVRGQNGETA